VLASLTPGEVAVGHENYYLSEFFCPEDNYWVLRGAVHFPLTLRDARPGFHERERAFLTWRMADASERVEGSFFNCTSAVAALGPARWEWEAGAYANETPPPTWREPFSDPVRALDITDTLFVVHDTDVRVPGTTSPGLRRLDVTEIVRKWVEGMPNFGFVLKGDESFRCRGNIWSADTSNARGHRWEHCIAIYSGFELMFARIGITPPWGRLLARRARAKPLGFGFSSIGLVC
jgi:hypothetical protein